MRAHIIQLRAALSHAAPLDPVRSAYLDQLHQWRVAELVSSLPREPLPGLTPSPPAQIWHLFEVLYIRGLPGSSATLVAPLLLDWLHLHFTSAYLISALGPCTPF